MTNQDVYQFTTQLRNFKPRMWRNFEISSDATVSELLYTVMIMFRIHGYQSYKAFYRSPEPLMNEESETDEDVHDADMMLYALEDNQEVVYSFAKYIPIKKAAQVVLDWHSRLANKTMFKLADLNLHKNSYLDLVFGMNDSYVIRIKFTSKQKQTKQDNYLPKVTAGSGYGVFEAIEKFETFKKLAKSWQHKDELSDFELYFARTMLHCNHLDLDRFDVKTINNRIEKLLPLYQKMQENNYEPTEAEREFLISSD